MFIKKPGFMFLIIVLMFITAISAAISAATFMFGDVKLVGHFGVAVLVTVMSFLTLIVELFTAVVKDTVAAISSMKEP